MNMDEIDKNIIKLLSENSRMTFKDLGKKLGVCDVTVKNRIERLLKEGVIKTFTLIVDPEKVGSKVAVIIDVNVEPHMMDEIVKKLKDVEEFYAINKTIGSHNLVISGIFKDHKHMSTTIDKYLNVPGIRDYNVKISLKNLKLSNLFIK